MADAAARQAGFDGFSPEALAFLEDLAAHNERDWFKANQDVYEREIKRPLARFVEATARRLEGEGLGLTGTPKTSIFRIHRDIRFAKDKTPYKAHAACYFSATGSKKEDGGVYVHVQPGASFLGAGVYRPERPALTALRRAMAQDPGTFLATAKALAAAGLPLDTDGALKTLPRGFADRSDTPIAPYLRWTSFLVRRRVSDLVFLTPEAVDEVVAFARDSAPLRDYARAVLGGPRWRADAAESPGRPRRPPPNRR